MKELYIHCDGGFGNRFNALVVGLLIAEMGNFVPIISWPSTNVCRALYADIFESEYQSNQNRLEEYEKNMSEYEFVMHENQLGWGTFIRSPYSFKTISDLIEYFNNSTKTKLFYFNNLIPNYLDFNPRIISKIKFKKYYYDIVDSISKPSNYIGVHLRSTDFPSRSIDFENIFNIISNSDNDYFICSDSFELEEKFNSLENVFTYKKTSYVKKIDPSKNWNVSRGELKDEFGKKLNYNVERDVQSVKDSIVDLILLSKSDIMETSNSTFSSTAQLLKYFSKDNG